MFLDFKLKFVLENFSPPPECCAWKFREKESINDKELRRGIKTQ